ncbi:lipopolysaccharide biosynthesis protein [Pedobacter mucosus]|uniref:lipopolysaccharide biosynthesis protein n=1 Tax=Pedobacter mucosus TaxID=2895286 RepID=UPI001EE44A83|nr:oligosaccharide flippase family protein [Pedobacter mucosus]UKT63278.1 oligosaccharide flippase family protein [Pedobacter mucosus]
MNKIALIIKNFFTSGHERTLLAKKNIAATFLIKGLSIIISLVLVPITIHYINPTEFGIWITMSSFVTWFAFFDIGFGNGLKNKLAETIAQKDYAMGRIYVSTTYFMLILISLGLLIFFFILNAFLDWTKVLNAPAHLAHQLSLVVLVVFSAFAIQFVLQLLNMVIAAKQNVFISSLIGLIGNILSLIIIYTLSLTTKGSLLYLGLAISLSPLVVFTIFSIVLYKGPYKEFSPSFRLVQTKYIKDLMSLGLKFFIIQLGLIFFYNADNLIITNIISPEAVTAYSIAFKFFSVITMISAIVMAPIWPAFTEANAKEDYAWIKLTINRLLKFCVLVAIVGLIMLVASPYVYKLWVGDKIKISFSLSAVLLAFTVINTYRTIFCFYLNGIGKIQLELYIIVTAGLLNIPLGIFMGKLWGTTGVMLATTILCIVCGIIETIQYRKIINKKAYGIWNR